MRSFVSPIFNGTRMKNILFFADKESSCKKKNALYECLNCKL